MSTRRAEKNNDVEKTMESTRVEEVKKGVRAGKFKGYPEEVKQAAVKAVREGRSCKEVSRIFGVGNSTVCDWVDLYAPGFRKKHRVGWQRVDKSVKLAAVEQVKAGRSVPEVADEFGVTNAALYKWVKIFAPGVNALLRKVDLGEIKEQMRKADEEKERAETGRVQAAEEAQSRVDEMVSEIKADPLVWMQKYTETKDSHWRERGASSPSRPLPDKPYFRPSIEDWQREKVVFIEKSRNMMLSWLAVGFFTHAAMTTPGIAILFQSQKEEKAFDLVEYAKILYDRQRPELKRAFALTKRLKDMADGELHFANGSRIIGIPGGSDQIRSYHPWGLLMDEAAFMPEAGDAYNNALSVCQKILVVSSAGPGWFGEVCNSGQPLPGSSSVPGFTRKQSQHGLIQRVHYSADPERGAEWVAEARKRYSSQNKWDREQEIVHEAGGGERIFAEVLGRWADKILIDPKESGFQASPHWKRISAFDYGKANPTAALVACVDEDSNLYILSEYYQPGLSPRQHWPNLIQLEGFLDGDALADPSIFFRNQAQSDGSFKAIADLYIEEGIRNLMPAPRNAEIAGMEKILSHWLDLDNREPTLRIICPRSLRGISRPLYGVHNEGCPNLVWELLRARREELSAGQLVNRNPTERVVDKDNHLRDCLKYLCLAFTEASRKTPEQKANEAIKDIPLSDPTSRVIRWQDAFLKAKGEDTPKPIPMGCRAARKLKVIEARRQRHWANLFRDPSN